MPETPEVFELTHCEHCKNRAAADHAIVEYAQLKMAADAMATAIERHARPENSYWLQGLQASLDAYHKLSKP